MKLGRLPNTHRHALFVIATLTQVTLNHFNFTPKERIKRLNLAIQYALTYCFAPAIPKLDANSLRMIEFFNSSISNSRDLSTQLRYIIVLCGHQNKSVPMTSKSYELRRIIRSAMNGKVVAFADVRDAVVTLLKEMCLSVGYRFNS